MADDDRIGELERSFRRAGLPTFVRGYSARRAFAKALPLLAIVFVLDGLGAHSLAARAGHARFLSQAASKKDVARTVFPVSAADRQ